MMTFRISQQQYLHPEHLNYQIILFWMKGKNSINRIPKWNNKALISLTIFTTKNSSKKKNLTKVPFKSPRKKLTQFISNNKTISITNNLLEKTFWIPIKLLRHRLPVLSCLSLNHCKHQKVKFNKQKRELHYLS